jgi:hypothetical protein
MAEPVAQPTQALPADVRAGLVQWVQHELQQEKRVSASITADRKELRAMAARLREVADQLESMASRKVGRPVVMVRTSDLEPDQRPSRGQFVIGRFEDESLKETAQRMRKSADDCSATADGLPRPQSRPWQRQVSALFLRQHLIERGPFNSAQLPITLSEFGPLVTEFVSLLHEAGYNRGGRATSEKRAFEWLLDARRAIEQEVNEVLLSSDIRN